MMLRHLDVSLVLDVGANEGQYAAELRRLGYGGRIVSFEPMAREAAALAQRARGDALWTAVRTAIGDRQGTTTINVASNSVSSSLLPMLDRHLVAAPGARYVSSEEVPITTLAAAMRDLVSSDDRVFLKVDVQGYHREVFRGALDVLGAIVGIQCEFSLAPLYQGEMLLTEGLTFFAENGFALMGLEPGFRDARSGRLLQVDALGFRDEAVTEGSIG